MKVAMVLALIAVSLFALGGAALATTGQNGPTPPAVSDPVGSNVSPHGGFSASTNYCLQCHSVHSAPGGGARGYALQATQSVTATCQTCHALFGASGGRVPAPGLPQTASGSIDSNARVNAPVGAFAMGTASSRSAYDIQGATMRAEHSLGDTDPPAPDGGISMYEVGWGYGGFNPARWEEEVSGSGTASYAQGGLYCGSCHTPHGAYGQAINTKYYRSEAGPGANEQQRIYLDHPQTGFQYTLTFGSATTGAITYGATATAVQTELEALPNLNPGDVTVAAAGTSGYTVTFVGPTYGLFDAPQMVPTDLNTLGAAAVGTVVPGGPAGSLEAAYRWQDGAPIYDGATIKYLNLNAGVWEKCNDNSATPAGCVVLTKVDSEGQTKYLYGYNLLTGYPNHRWDNPESWGVAYRGRDAARWCGACHPSKVDSEFGTAFTQHNHPTDCTYCHGNPNDQTVVSADYPHTSTFGKFLKAYPDGICVSCHTDGSLV